MPPLRIYSQNVCVLPAGASERHLQTGFVLGMVTTFSLLFVWATHCTRVPFLWRSFSTAIFLFSGAWTGAAGHFALILWGAPQWVLSRLLPETFTGPLHDYKRERLAALADKLAPRSVPLYDVVLLQEFFGAWYSDANRQAFVAAMADRGYVHAALPPAAGALPSVWANSGLAIFSPHPISDVATHNFKKVAFFDRFMVNRGVLGATLAAPGGLVRAYSAHLSPPLSVLGKFKRMTDSSLAAMFRYFDVHKAQVAEVAAVLNKAAPAHGGEGDGGTPTLVIGGDFNAMVSTPHYDDLVSTLSTQCGMAHLTEALLEPEGAPMTANPPGELLLTNGTREQLTVDYVFARGADVVASKSRVLRQEVAAGSKAFQMVSDHCGLSVEAERTKTY